MSKTRRRKIAPKKKKKQKLKALGIDYDFAGYSNKTTNDPEEASNNEMKN